MILRRAAMGLSGISFLLFAVGADVIIIGAAKIDPHRIINIVEISEQTEKTSADSMALQRTESRDMSINTSKWDLSSDTVMRSIQKSLEPSIFFVLLLKPTK